MLGDVLEVPDVQAARTANLPERLHLARQAARLKCRFPGSGRGFTLPRYPHSRGPA